MSGRPYSSLASALCSPRRLVRGVGSVLGQHWWYWMMSCLGLAWHPSCRRAVDHRVWFPLLKTITLSDCLVFYKFETLLYCENSCKVISCDVKYVVIVSLDSPSCEVTLFDPVYRWFIGMLPDRPIVLYRLKYEVALRQGLAYLSRYNSGWSCHRCDITGLA
jgi:hypothetical protein